MDMRLVSRSLLVCVISVAFGVCSQSVVAAATESHGEEGASPVGSLTGAPLVVAGADQMFLGGEEMQAAREARRSNPVAVAARQASRTSFEGFSPGQAADEARVAFPDLIEQPAAAPPQLPAGQHIVRYATDNAAQVALPGGQVGLIESLAPIAARTPHGGHAPLDLRLEEADGHFQPVLSDVGVKVPKDLANGVSLTGTGVSLTPVDEHSGSLAASEGALDGDAVLWSDAEGGATDGVHDLATVAKPSQGGFDLTSMLLSQRSPGVLYFRVGMPAGARLQSGEDGSERVVKDGSTLAIVSPVSAEDAEGSEVPVSTAVRGDVLVVSVDRSGDYLYPIAVDPEVVGVDAQLVKSGGKLSNWIFETNAPSKYEGSAIEGAKEYLETKGKAEYRPGEVAYWRYQTQGVSKIYGITTTTSAKNKNAKIASYLEFENSAGFEETRKTLSTEPMEPEYENKPAGLCAANGAKKEEPVCLSSYGSAHNVVHFEQSPSGEPGSNYKFSDSMSQGTVSISEPEGTHSTTSFNEGSEKIKVKIENAKKETEEVERTNVLHGTGHWLSGYEGAFETIAKDTGIGVAATKLEYERSAGKWEPVAEHNYLEKENGCSGVQCYEKHNEAWALPNLPDGEDKIRYSAKEAMSGTESLPTEGLATVKVDTTRPYAVELEGLPGGNELSERPYELTAEATDGEGATIPSSGMKSIKLLVDGHSLKNKEEKEIEEGKAGKEAGKKEGECSTPKGACTASARYTINGAELGAGHHSIQIEAFDNAGNEAGLSGGGTQISIRHSTPVALGPGSVDLQSGDYSLGASDVSLGSGLTVSRNYSSRATEEGIEGPLGPQWNMSLGNSESLTELIDGAVMLTASNGKQTIFANLGGGKFESPTGDSNLVLEFEENKTTKENAYYLKDPAAGTSDKFTRPTGSKVWVPTKQAGTVATDTVTYAYETVEHQDQFPVESSEPQLSGIDAGPDGNIWFTDEHNNKIGKMSLSGSVLAEYATHESPGVPGSDIVSGSDGNLWFLEGSATLGQKWQIVKMTTSGSQTAYSLPAGAARLAAGPDGNMWFTEPAAKKVAKITPTGTITQYAVPKGEPFPIVSGTEGHLWFMTSSPNKIDMITTSGTVTEYAAPSESAGLIAVGVIAASPDGDAWFTEPGKIDKITPGGVITSYPLATSGDLATAMTVGPDKNIWFTQYTTAGFKELGKITPSGVITEYTAGKGYGITTGPDGNIWYTESFQKKIGRSTTSGTITRPSEIFAPIPSGVSCSPEMKAGCRALKFSYEGSGGLLTTVSLKAYNPTSKKIESSGVASYSYNERDQLVTEKDPRHKALVTTYGYDPEGHVTALTAPGQETWAFTYGAISGDTGTGRLLKAAIAPASESLWNGETVKNTGTPTISGSPIVGSRMGVSDGAWSGSPIAHGYQWARCTSLGVCTVIAGATSANYIPTVGDEGHMLVAFVTATNGGGSAVAESGATTAVQAFSSAQFTEYALPTGSGPSGITPGPDGNVWFTDSHTAKAGKITSSGTVTEYASTSGTWPEGITSGPDGNLWFVNNAGNLVNHMTTSGALTTYSLLWKKPTQVGIAAGPDQNLWFTESGTGYIGKITTGDEVLGEYALPYESAPYGIATGPDGNLWFTDNGTSKIGKITTSGAITEYGLPSGGKPYGIATGPDGNLWFTDNGTSKIGKITTSGAVTEYALPSGSAPRGIAMGPGGTIWFTDYGTNKIGRISTTGVIAEYALPAGSRPQGIAEGPDGNMWYTDNETSKIGKINLTSGEYRAPQSGSTIDYSVPLQGATAPNQMGTNATTHKPEPEKWGQSDDPVEATAIFPPDESQGWPASGYKRASVYYLDEQGREVNVASPSTSANGSITTTEYNEYNDVVRTLSPDNRQAALVAGGKSVEVSKLLDTQSTYNGEGEKEGTVKEPGTRLIKVLGPQHEIKYMEGAVQKESLARLNTKYFYDEGAPEGTYDLVTKTSSLAQLANEEEREVRKTITSYSGQSGLGWELRAPTSVTNDPEGKKITHTTLYNVVTNKVAPGQIIETRGSAGAGGGSAHDARVIYYGAEANTEGFAACGSHPEWAGLVCETLPAKQPAGSPAPQLPVTTKTYNIWNEPLVITETFGTTVRTKTETYDEAGRLKTSETTSTADTALPKVTNEYNSTTGALEKQSTTVEGKTKTVTSKYNTLGQRTEYTDADGNTAKYKYAGPENDGLLEEVSDASGAGTGKQTYTYNATTKQMETLTDSSAGTFTASHDVEGKLTSETYPNGMCANDTYNAAGEATHVEYIKTSNCAEHEPGVWFSETRTPSVRGETFSRASTLASEEYFYDTIGRLTEAQETPAGEGCTKRLYGYDEESNRTSQTTRTPGTEGKCATTGGTTLAHTYDEGNRLTDTGIAYDAFGNVTKLPAVDAEGHELVSTFYVDGAVATQSQNGVSNSYYLDPEGRVRETISGTTTTINHYDGPGEAVAWTSEGEGKSKRNIPGIDGALAATQTNSETPVLQLHDMQGDVVATIGDKTGETKLLSTYNSTEFGVPNGGKTPPKFAWLGSMGIESSLSSGVITYGATSYVPQTGMALQSEQVEAPGRSGGSGAGAAYVMQADPWNMWGAERAGAEMVAVVAAEERAAAEAARKAAMEAALEGEGIDPEGYVTRGQANWGGNRLKIDAEGEQAYTDATLVLGLMDDAIEWLAGQIVDEFVGTAKIIDWTHKFGAKLSGCSKAVVFSFCRVHWKLRHVEISTPFGGIKLFEFPDYDYVPEVEECSSNISGPFQVCTRIPHK